MNRFSSLTAAALLTIGGMLLVGCQGQNDANNPDNTNGARDQQRRLQWHQH
jgi:hypothetical protein